MYTLETCRSWHYLSIFDFNHECECRVDSERLIDLFAISPRHNSLCILKRFFKEREIFLRFKTESFLGSYLIICLTFGSEYVQHCMQHIHNKSREDLSLFAFGNARVMRRNRTFDEPVKHACKLAHARPTCDSCLRPQHKVTEEMTAILDQLSKITRNTKHVFTF